MKVLSSFPRTADRTEDSAGEGSPALSALHSADGVQVRSLLRRRLGGGTPDWFLPLIFRLEDGENRVLTVSMPHELFFRWFDKRGRADLEKAARSLLGSRTALRYEWPQGAPAAFSPLSGPASPAPLPSAGFDDFLVSGRNRDALRLFRAALRQAPRTMLLRGASGTGKSHLACAAFRFLSERFHGRAVFLSGSELLARARRSPDVFLRLAHGLDAVVIDDLQFLESSPSAQRELSALLDSLDKRVFFLGTMSQECSLMPELHDRLCSHLALHLSEPDLDVRMRFAQMFMERSGLPEHRPTAFLLARRCLRLRHIQGILEHVRMRYEQDGRMPSSEELERILEHFAPAAPADVDSILAAVASNYGCTSAQLRENTRNKELSQPRQIAMYLCRRLLGESYPSLGLIFGGKDHSTIMYAVKKIEKLKVTNKDVHMLITKLTKQCANSASEAPQML